MSKLHTPARRLASLLLAVAVVIGMIFPDMEPHAHAAKLLRFGESTDGAFVEVPSTSDYSAYWKTDTSTHGWKYETANRRLTFLDLEGPGFIFEETEDMEIAVAGTNQAGRLEAAGNLTIMGTGILLVDELVCGGTLSISGVAVFLREDAGVYRMISDGLLQDAEYTLPEGNSYLMSGTKLTIDAQKIDEKTHTSKLIIPDDTTLTLQVGSEISLEGFTTLVSQGGASFTGKIDVAGTLILENGSIIAGRCLNSITLEKTGGIFCNGSSVLQNMRIKINMAGQSFRLNTNNCAIDIFAEDELQSRSNQFNYTEREITVFSSTALYLHRDFFDYEGTPFYFAIDKINLPNAESNLEIGADANHELIIRDGAEGPGTLVLSGGSQYIYGTGVDVGAFNVNGCTASIVRTKDSGPAVTADSMKLWGARVYARSTSGRGIDVPASGYDVTDTYLWSVGGLGLSDEELEVYVTDDDLYNVLRTSPSYLPDTGAVDFNWMMANYKITLSENAIIAMLGAFSSVRTPPDDSDPISQTITFKRKGFNWSFGDFRFEPSDDDDYFIHEITFEVLSGLLADNKLEVTYYDGTDYNRCEPLSFTLKVRKLRYDLETDPDNPEGDPIPVGKDDGEDTIVVYPDSDPVIAQNYYYIFTEDINIELVESKLPLLTSYEGGYTFSDLQEILTPGSYASAIPDRCPFSHFELFGFADGMPVTVRISDSQENNGWGAEGVPQGFTLAAINTVYIKYTSDGGGGGSEQSLSSDNTGKAVLGGGSTNASALCAVGVHTYGTPTPVKAATCTAPGTQTATCASCSTSINQSTGTAAHKYSVSQKAATCTEDGSTHEVCSECSGTRNLTAVPATGHSFSGKTCSACGAENPDYKPPAGPITVTPAPTTDTKLSADGLIKIDENGNLSVTLSKEDEENLLKALESGSSSSNTIEITIKAPAGTQPQSVSLQLSPALMAAAAKNGKAISFDSPVGCMRLESGTLTALASGLGEGAGGVVLVMNKASGLTEAQTTVIGSAPYIDLQLLDENGNPLEFTGEITVTFYFPVAEGQDPSGYVLMHIDDDSNVTEIPCVFSAGKAVFKLSHFSVYFIQYRTELVWIHGFTDVRPDDWFYGAVRYVSKAELFKGTSETTFSPHITMTRGMLVTVLWRLEGMPEASDSAPAFTDVIPGEYYEKAVLWAAENGIALGTGDGEFSPDDALKREQAVTLLYRYAEYAGYDVTVTSDEKFAAFTDAGQTADWAYDAFCWAIEAGIINGNGDGTVSPQGENTRAHTAQLLYNLSEALLSDPEPIE